MIPELTPQQRAAARDAATRARRARADLKRAVTAGECSLGEAIDRAMGDPALANMYVVDLLKALPRVGDKRAALVMERHDIAVNRRIRGLGHRQIAGLKQDFS